MCSSTVIRPVLLVLFGMAVAVGGCGGTQPTGPQSSLTGSWVSRIDGTDAFVAIASNGNEVMAYVCDGKSASQWFQADAGADKVDLAGGFIDLNVGGPRLQAQLKRGAAEGSVTLADGVPRAFQGFRAAGDAGLYRLEETVNGERRLGGWVVLNDGQLRGLIVNLDTGTVQTQTTINRAATMISPTLVRY